jgi:hypothetical protein
MFDHMSMKKAKEAYERMSNRIASVRKESEKVIGRGLQVAETAGSSFAWGYANHKWGTVPASDAAALPEVQLLGLPADLGAGVLMVGAGFFGAFGRYEEHGFNVGAGSIGAFAYRMGAELGAKSEHTQAPKRPKAVTSGYGRMHSVVDERQPAYAQQ